MLFPSGLALVLAIFPPAQRQLAIGIWAAMGGLAGAMGPSLGAVLIQAFGWRAVFLFNVPLAAFTIPSGGGRSWTREPKACPDTSTSSACRSHRWASVPWCWPSPRAEIGGWSSPAVLISLAVAAGFASAFVVRSKSHPAPLFDLSLFRIRTYRVALVGSVLFAGGFFGSWVLMPSFI